MKMYSATGAELMDLEELHRDGDNLVIKGKVLRMTPIETVLKPEDLVEMTKLLTPSLFFRIPVMYLQGLWRTWKARKTPAAE